MSENRSASRSAATSSRTNSGRVTAGQYRNAAIRVVLHALAELTAIEGAVSKRRLVNFLRGRQAPPAEYDEGCYALFEPFQGRWVEELVDQLVAVECIELGGDQFRHLELTQDGRRAQRKGLDTPEVAFPERPVLGAAPRIEEGLRELRRRLARRDGRAPYTVFPNGTLAALAVGTPRTMAELAAAPGMGQARVERYGRSILAAIRRLEAETDA